MRRLDDDSILLSPTDLNTYLGCRHASALDYRAHVVGEQLVRTPDDDGLTLIKRRGDEHERAHFETLTRVTRGEILRLERRDLAPGALETEAAMRRGAALIYQGVLWDGVAWHGYSDFLVRAGVVSSLGDWSYEVHDTKLARSVKAKFAIQLAIYADLVTRIQGRPPPALRVALGDGTSVELYPRDYVHYVRRAMHRLEAAVRLGGPDDPGPGTVAEPCGACPECGWRERCADEWAASDHLHAVCNIRGSQTRRLREAGIGTVAALAMMDPELRVPGIDDRVLARLRAQAALQMSVRGQPDVRRLEMLPQQPGRGLARLTPPDANDLFFDMEGDPLYPGGGLEYMFGVEGIGRFQAFWALDRAAERGAFEAFMDHAWAVMSASPDARIYHYNHYETTALKRLAMTYGTREAQLDELLRGGRFVDLYVVVREAMRTSEPGLSLKDVERFYRQGRDGAVGTAADSIVAFERWLETQEQPILDGIEAYNRDDCASTRELRDWLLAMRPVGMPWNQRVEPDENEQERARKRAEDEARAQELRERLLDDVPEADRSYRELVSHLAAFHRREQKPAWWAMFNRQTMTADELAEDLECLGGLEAVGNPVPVKRSFVQTYRYPEQDTKLEEGDTVVDAATLAPCGTIRGIDPEARTVDLGWGVGRGPYPRSLSIGPGGPLDARDLEGAVNRFVASVLAGDGRYAALEAILRREPPRVAGLTAGAPLRLRSETALAAALRACRGLQGSYLFVQGPPGTGKTWTASRLILDALDRGLRVGVSALSHKAINNLLQGVEQAAAELGRPLRGWKRANKEKRSTHLGSLVISDAFDDKDIPADAPLVGATAYYWAKPDRDRTVDLMVVDEAGQVSLAGLVATCTAARDIVLVGDQMQLGQPIQGTHPGGSGASALEHLLGGAPVVPDWMGVFLEETRRMHPSICDWVSQAIYDNRLTAHPLCAGQAIIHATDAGTSLAGAGIRFLPVDHQDRSQVSPEEVEAVQQLWHEMRRHSWRDTQGTERPIRPEDILVVTPWNAQVNALSRALPEARIGTVDRFQGQEAAAVIISMATSGKDTIPRGTGFLFSRERLNVAVSRARCLVVVVASPHLLELPCSNVEDLRLVNTLCWLASWSQPVGILSAR